MLATKLKQVIHDQSKPVISNNQKSECKNASCRLSMQRLKGKPPIRQTSTLSISQRLCNQQMRAQQA